MSFVQATRLRKGMLIKLNETLYRVLDLHHLTPGKGKGFVQSKLRAVLAGTLTDHRFRSEDSVERASLDVRTMQYMYSDGDLYHFMDTGNYEQVHIAREAMGDAVNYLVADAIITVGFYDGAPVGIDLPATVDLVVEETAPGIKGATASAQVKPARLETGLVVQVPPFVNDGDTIRVNTETGEYQARV
jgi:elongation factor P